MALALLLILADVVPPQGLKEMPARDPADKKFGTNIPDEINKAADSQPGKQSMSDVVNTLIWCSIGLLVFGLVALGVVGWLLAKGKIPADRGVQAIVVILALTFGAFVTVAGYGSTQIAALMGLIGGVLGYVFAKESKGDKSTSGAP